MEYFDRDRYYLRVDDCIQRNEDERLRDKEFVKSVMEKFHITNEDGEDEIIVLPTEEFYYLIATVISEYESYLKLFPKPDES